MSASASHIHREVLRLMQAQDWPAAEQALEQLNAQFPEFAAGWYAASRVALILKRANEALARIDRAVSIDPYNPHGLIQRAQCLLALGRHSEACEVAAAAQQFASSDPVLMDTIGGVFHLADDQPRALGAYDQAVSLAPDKPHFLFNRAAVRRFVGQFAEAEADFDRVIALRPTDYEAYKTRSDLRTQTTDKNHITELEVLVAKTPLDWRGEVQIRYALAKEYEDLGEYGKSFSHLKLGGKKRREHMRYDVSDDIWIVDWIIKSFPERPSGITTGASEEAPIFIVGLPRSGTTLVDRILGSHSSVHSAGELRHFALCIVDAVRGRTGEVQVPRRELVARSTELDFAALGKDYLNRVRLAGVIERRFTDKMPLNYLYCGLIHRALPNARIVHLTRHPLAVCYAMYKTLFNEGYPFSYDLTDIGRYYIAYRRLMDHWNRTLPTGIHTIRYEDLVASQVGETRRLLDFCRLPWENSCLNFHQSSTAATTASAAQVRRKIYDSSVTQWRHYEIELTRLRAQLEAAGIDLAS